MNVVLLHAFPLDERMWEPQLPALASHDVTAPNLYDLGGSSVDGWAQRILDEVEGDLVAVGASMGGYVALALARLAPERIRGLLLAGARPDADSPERRAGRAATIELVENEGPPGLWENQRDKLFGEHAPEAAVELARTMALSRQVPDLVRAIEAIRDRPDSTGVLQADTGCPCHRRRRPLLPARGGPCVCGADSVGPPGRLRPLEASAEPRAAGRLQPDVARAPVFGRLTGSPFSTSRSRSISAFVGAWATSRPPTRLRLLLLKST